MAKINKFIASYADAVADLEISSDATIPPKAVIRRFVRVFKNIDAIKKALPVSKEELRQICVDGKEQCGTGRKYDTDEKVRNLQTLHIYDASNEICIYSEAIDGKTNEIPVAQKALKSMKLKGCIVTFDALHMQKDTVAIIKERNIFGWNLELYLMSLLICFDTDTLINSVYPQTIDKARRLI